MHWNKRIFSLSPIQSQQQGHTQTFLQASRVLTCFLYLGGQIECGGLTHAGQQMSGSLRLGQLISMTNRSPQPPPPHPHPTPQEALLLSDRVEAMGHRWCWFLWRATVDDCQNALGLVEREGCRLVQPPSFLNTHTYFDSSRHIGYMWIHIKHSNL